MATSSDHVRLLTTATAFVALVICNCGILDVFAQGDDATLEANSVRDGTVDFRRDVYPLLKQHCFRCHEGQDADSGYRLDLRAEILGETNGEPLAVAGKSGESRLIHLVARDDPDQVMPPDGEGEPLSGDQVAMLRAWIDQGLAWDDELLPAASSVKHWAFKPIMRPAIPVVQNKELVLTPIDAFVAAEHERRGLSPALPAPPQTLIRRLSLDLTGLPPSPDEIDEFVADDRPDAYERLVDRLLASPRYGERWGRHWLDVARWAESEGYESNHLRPYAWRYRDWVIAALNEDKPYDLFLRQQIAGDEMLPYRDEHLIATGFLAAARLSSNEEDKWLQRNAVLVDIVNATASAVLGLTMNCAQCHNHKFDPITQRDYYAFQAFFVKGQPNNLVLNDERLWQKYRANVPPEYEAAVKLRDAMFEQARQRAAEEARAQLSPEMRVAVDTREHQRTKRQHELARQADLLFQLTPNGIEKHIPADDKKLYDELKKKIERRKREHDCDKPQTWGFYSPATSPTKADVLPMVGFYPLTYDADELFEKRAYLLVRGDVHGRGPEVEPMWPAIFGLAESSEDKPIEQATFERQAGSLSLRGDGTRTQLVDWITDRSNPLTARVWVNRIWQFHFGRGIVATPGDFGLKGDPPSHPELLDWLAVELIDSGWSTKHIHRLIMLSSTYCQSSRMNTANAESDPDNRFLWRWNARRIEAEGIRDAALAIGGELDLNAGGTGDADDASLRRTVYLLHQRERFPEVVQLFDGPTANESCAERHVSTVAPQPLYLLNSTFMLNRARALAARVEQQAGDDTESQIEAAFRITLGRAPSSDERSAALEFFRQFDDNSVTIDDDVPDRILPLVQFGHALINLNEFVYIE